MLKLKHRYLVVEMMNVPDTEDLGPFCAVFRFKKRRKAEAFMDHCSSIAEAIHRETSLPLTRYSLIDLTDPLAFASVKDHDLHYKTEALNRVHTHDEALASS